MQRPDTMTEAVSKHIRDAIVGGTFEPGARLPVIALATDLNTSRGTIREALRMLADRGLVDVFPRRGAFVAQLSPRATWEITSLRALLEPYAARLALEASGSSRVYQEEVRSAFDRLRLATIDADPVAVAAADVEAAGVGLGHGGVRSRGSSTGRGGRLGGGREAPAEGQDGQQDRRATYRADYRFRCHHLALCRQSGRKG